MPLKKQKYNEEQIPIFDEASIYKNGNKVIELEQGKNAIKLSSKSKLEPTLQSIKKDVDNGELDILLEEQLEYGGSRLTKKTKLIVYLIDLY